MSDDLGGGSSSWGGTSLSSYQARQALAAPTAPSSTQPNTGQTSTTGSGGPTTLTLGQFTFQDFEIPESIPFGGEQRLVVKKLVGGARVIDAMGVDPAPLAWSGVFLGPTAMSRAGTLKKMSEGGQVYPLLWDALGYRVLIQSFVPDFRRPYYIPYRISCEVLADISASLAISNPNMTDAINADSSAASSLCDGIGNGPLSTAMGTLKSAISSVSDFAKASQSVINSVVQPLAAVQAQASLLIASTDKTLMNVATVGGLIPNNPISRTVAQLGNYVAASTQQPMLLNLSGLLGRIGTNVGQVNSSVRTVTVPGGNLFDLASKHYGDATGWTAIAAANPALKGEPQLSGITTLVIPAFNNRTGGIR